MVTLSTTLNAPVCCYCGFQNAHMGYTCPRIEEIEYHPDGTVKRVKLRTQ